MLNVWVFCLHICLCTRCIPCAHGGQKWALDPLQLQLHMVVRDHMGAGNWTPVLWENSWCSYPWSHLFIFHVLFFEKG